MPEAEPSRGGKLGLLLGTFIGPDRLRSHAIDAEAHGFDELWLAEDYFFTGGISSATAVLGATARISVSTGIVSGLVRHPAVLAMELSTIAGVFGDRLRGGIALGHPPWLRQMGLYPKSPLTAMEECVTAIRSLMAGETVTRNGQYFCFDDVSLTYPLPVPILMGGVAPKMLQLAGQIADGHVVPLLASPAYVKWADARIATGMAAAGRTQRGPLSVFVLFSVDDDGDAARGRLRETVAYYLVEALNVPALIEPNGIVDDLRQAVSQGGVEAVIASLSDEWIRMLTVAGTPDECTGQIRRYFAAGADSVVLYPMPSEISGSMIDIAAAKILPELRAGL